MKKALATHDIEEILRAGAESPPEPPEGLLAALKEEIPAELEAGVTGRRGSARRRPARLIAATLFLAVVGAVVTYRVRDGLEQPLKRVAPNAAEDARPGTAADSPGVASEPPAPPDPVTAAVERGTTEVADRASKEIGARPTVAPSPPPPATVTDEVAVPATRSEAAESPTSEGRRGARTESGSGGDRHGLERPQERVPEAPDPVSAGETRAEGRFETLEAPPEAPARKLRQPVDFVDKMTARAGASSPEASVATGGTWAEPKAERPPVELGPRRVGEMTRRRILVPPGPPPSTGGTAEPNDQVYGDMFFRDYGTNPFVDTEVDPLSTFGLDVDTGSYTVARSYLERRVLPPSESVRVEEFVNYFDYGDRPPRRGDFSIVAEGAPSPLSAAPGYRLLRFGLHGREIGARERKPAVLTFVVDVSGSMARENRLGLVKRSLHLLLDELEETRFEESRGGRESARPGDRVGLVVYGSRGEILLEPSGDFAEVRRAIDRLQPGGSTNAEEGLVLGYRLARESFWRGGINRVILCSDGVANVGRTGPESILARIAREAEAGIELTTVGFGMGNYNDVLMEQLADRGDGRYAYVDTLAEARRLFVRDLSGTLETIASDAKIQVEFDPRVVSLYRLLGYENRDVADKRFRDDTVDAGEIGAGHRVTALYEIKLRDDATPGDTLATLRLRYRAERTGRVEEESLPVRVRDLESSWRAAPQSLRLASVVAEFAEILKGSYWTRDRDLGDLTRRARRLEGDFRGEIDVAELARLIETAGRLGAEDRSGDFEE